MASSLFAPAEAPKSLLGRHRILSPTASVRVSPICLGTMNFGDAWESFMGKCSKETAFGVLDFFYENGGNFIDTANNYQNEEAETWLGEWMSARGVRDQMVVATKYTTGYRNYKRDTELQSNFVGNGTKSMRHSVEASLRKLQTDYIDILYVHWWDHSASIPEVMQALNQLVLSGKVLYLAISDTPAWIVSKANEYARSHGLRQFCLYQGRWSAADRAVEREILPMIRAEGMAIAPWAALGGGKFKTEEQLKSSEGRQFGPPSEIERQVSKVLEKLANAKKTAITSIALAYVIQKVPYVFPIVGGRKLEHLKGNIDALSIELTDEEMKEIEGAAPFDLGFPHNMIGQESDQNALLVSVGVFDRVQNPKAIAPVKN